MLDDHELPQQDNIPATLFAVIPDLIGRADMFKIQGCMIVIGSTNMRDFFLEKRNGYHDAPVKSPRSDNPPASEAEERYAENKPTPPFSDAPYHFTMSMQFQVMINHNKPKSMHGMITQIDEST